ncbi:MAG: Y4bD/Y4pK family protein [Actinobacteria bacterium]|nr:Y4bD/Y4pK family protein [Actinomycetota bacterium]
MRVTHSFHPLAGQKFEFVKRRRNWQLDRVYFHDSAGELLSLPAEWTDAVPADPFVVVSGGSSPFHIASLLEASELIARVVARRS